MRSYFFSTSMAFVFFVSSPFSESVSGQQFVPFKGTFMGSFTATMTNPPFLDVALMGGGNATQLGRFSAVFPHRVDVSVVPTTAAGTYTFTTANGDKLFADVTGRTMPVAPGVLQIVEQATIKGGTGRFVGATGKYVMKRLINQVTRSTTGCFEGTISSVGASQH